MKDLFLEVRWVWRERVNDFRSRTICGNIRHVDIGEGRNEKVGYGKQRNIGNALYGEVLPRACTSGDM